MYREAYIQQGVPLRVYREAYNQGVPLKVYMGGLYPGCTSQGVYMGSLYQGVPLSVYNGYMPRVYLSVCITVVYMPECTSQCITVVYMPGVFQCVQQWCIPRCTSVCTTGVYTRV